MKSVAKVVGAMFSAPAVSRSAAVLRSEQLAAIQQVMAGCEHLANDHERRTGGVNDWAISRDSMRFKSSAARGLVDFVSQPDVTNVLHALRVASSAFLVTPYGSSTTRGVLGLFTASTSHLLATRQHFGGDGSDHAAVMVNTLTAAARLSGRNTGVTDALLWASALQGVLAYGVSGWVKVAGRPWRRHEAIRGVMRTVSYGQKDLFRLVDRYPVLGKLIGQATLVLECGFPVILVAGGRLTTPLLLAMGSLHVSIAGVMGLGRFVPAFFSMYPALVYTTGRSDKDHPRSDALPVVVAVISAGTAAWLRHEMKARQKALESDDVLDQRLQTSSGNELAYRVQGDGDPQRPVVVLQNGLMATAEAWEFVAAELRETATVVTYDPAGYGSSTLADGARPTVEGRVSDLRDLVEHVRTSAPVLVVGHSLGGLVAASAAAEGAPLDGVVLVDPTHPDELNRSPQQKVGAERLDESLEVASWSVRLGLGSFVSASPWVRLLPARSRRSAELKQAGRSLWRTGSSEWRELRQVLDAGGAAPAVPTECFVITAEQTAERDVAMLAMHDEMAGGEPTRRLVVEGATHESILTHPAHAAAVAQSITTFMNRIAAGDSADIQTGAAQ